MSNRIRMCFIDEGVTAYAELLKTDAPRTCEMVRKILPVTGMAFHAIYSGSEIAFVLDEDVLIPQENATHRVMPGDVAFAHFEGGVSYGIPNSFSELCWFYDRDATPSMADGPVSVNIFARIDSNVHEFYEVCRRIRKEGQKPFEVAIAAS